MERYIEFSAKEVVNIRDGKRLGRVVDLQINPHDGVILAVVVLDDRRRGLFRGRDEYIVPWQQICKVGDDVILVEAAGIAPYNGG
ncbi:MAG: YlmC/YmxH family sporulation protein [Clostridia bacterium]|nr:YlmC/YmxH family sporulation protein [Clostridia bacterium]